MSGRALIIDKDTPFAEQLSVVLEQEGFAVQTCNTGRDGIDQAKTLEPDLIVLCVELDDTSGYSICAKIKKDQRLKGIPLIITSENATQETFDHHKKLKTRAQAYLMKPFEPAELLKHVERPSSTVAPRSSTSATPPPLPPRDAEADLPDIGLESLSFNADEQHDVDGDFADVELDEAIASLSSGASGVHSNAIPLDGRIGLREEFDEDDVRTTIGTVPTGILETPEPSFPLENQIDAVFQPDPDARTGDIETSTSDELGAREHSSSARLELNSSNSSNLPGSATRDLIAAKKEINSKERNLLELREALQLRDRQLLDAKEKEAELEEQIVYLDEQLVDTRQAKEEGEVRADQLEKNLNGTIGELREEVSGLSDRLSSTERDLEQSTELNNQLRTDLERTRTDITQREGTIDEQDRQIADLNSELDQSRTEVRGLNEELDTARRTNESLETRSETAERDLRDTRLEVDRLRTNLSKTEARLERTVKRLQEESDMRGKARQALEIGLNLLNEAEYSSDPDFGSNIEDHDELRVEDGAA